jgi:putative transcriptional regulator
MGPWKLLSPNRWIDDRAMTSLKGHLLIAAPGLLDPMFTRSVVLLLDHDEDGAMGLILNVLTGTTMTDLAGKLFEEGFAWGKPLHLGGPVPGPLIVLHEIEELADREVVPGVDASLDSVKAQEVASRKAEPSLVVGNHAAWGSGQLEGEFGSGHWLTLPAKSGDVLWRESEEIWEATFKRANARTLSEITRIGMMPPDPRLN